MPSRGRPQHKGTGVLPVVKSLKSRARGRAAVPSELRHYLDEPIIPTAWYPEDEYERLLCTLANVMTEDEAIENVWELFGKSAARRDLAGDQSLVRDDARIDSAGVYRHFIGSEVTSVASLFVRAASLWRMYHDTGRVLIEPSQIDECVLQVRLVDFKFTLRGIAEMQSHYQCEYARLAGTELAVRLLQTSAEDAPCDVWEYTAPRTPEAIHSLAQLRRR